jgi:serine/threonine protein kinase
MAPEIWTSTSYSGVQADTFAACVVLFMMIVGRPPFRDTTNKDPHYAFVTSGDNLTFWEHQRSTELTPDLQDLFWNSFVSNRDRRLTIAQIRAHPAL